MANGDQEQTFKRGLQQEKRNQLRIPSAQQGAENTAAADTERRAQQEATTRAPLLRPTRKAKRSKQERQKGRTEAASRTLPEKKKLTGAIFYIMLGLTLIKDGADVALNLTGVLSVLTTVISVAISFIVLFYLMVSGVSLRSRKLAIYLGSVIIEAIPFLNVLPMATITLYAIRLIEHSEYAKKLAIKRAGK